MDDAKPTCQYTWYFTKDGVKQYGECKRDATTKIITNHQSWLTGNSHRTMLVCDLHFDRLIERNVKIIQADNL